MYIYRVYSSFDLFIQMNQDILVFRTDIRTRRQAANICNILTMREGVMRCTVDVQDCDKVLRVEVKWPDREHIVQAVRQQGFFIEELPD